MLSTSQVNDLFMQKVASEEPGDLRKAANAVQEYTRIRMREDGFTRKILITADIGVDTGGGNLSLFSGPVWP